MDQYSVQEESSRILQGNILQDSKLGLPEAFRSAAQNVKFVGADPQPFIATPCKITESSSVLNALVASAASAVAKDRYGGDYQDIEVNTDVASLFLMSFLLGTIKGQPALVHPAIVAECERGDMYITSKPIHRQCTNIYRTRDSRWYHLHGSMNASISMKMMGVPEQDVDHEEAVKIYGQKVAQWDSKDIERVANDEYRQAGVTCLTPDEFFASEQGRIMDNEPLYTLKPISTPRKPWPNTTDTKLPLQGIRVLDCSRVIAGPVISKMLAALGATVLKVSHYKLPDISTTWVDLSAGKRDCEVDLKTPEGKQVFRKLARDADVLIDGYRPGALERLGISPKSIREENPSLVYLRENCYGFKGPLAHRSGWQQISDCLVGLAWLQGRFMGLDEPIVPLLPNSDYQMGLAGATAVIHALYRRANEDLTFDIDISLTQYNIWYYRLGQYTPSQQQALLARNRGFKLRHFDEMSSLLLKTRVQVQKVRPDLFKSLEHFEKMSGKEWGVDASIWILKMPFLLSGSDLRCRVPSGRKGRSRPVWEEAEQADGGQRPKASL